MPYLFLSVRASKHEFYGDKMRRVGEQFLRKVNYVRRYGVYAILPIGEALLLTHQVSINCEFQLPGGGLDPAEQPIPALHREIMEETGWSITKPRKVGLFRRFVFMPEYKLWADKICSVYLARPVRRVCDPTEKGHTDHIVPIKLASEIVENPGDRKFILDFLEGRLS